MDLVQVRHSHQKVLERIVCQVVAQGVEEVKRKQQQQQQQQLGHKGFIFAEIRKRPSHLMFCNVQECWESWWLSGESGGL